MRTKSRDRMVIERSSPEAPDDHAEARLGDFVSRHWGRRPELLEAALRSPACAARDMLEIVRGLSERIESQAEVTARFYVDGLQVTPQHPLERAFLLNSSDRTLAAYVESVSRRLGEREFCIVIDDAALLNREVWNRMRQLAAQIVRFTGYPTGRIEYNAFLGTCQSTPFGIHSDRSHTFTLLAGGESKTMVTWPPQALTPIRGSRITKDPERIEMLVEQGRCWRIASETDALYMPAGWWHVSRKDRDCPFQSSLGLGFAMERTPATDLSELVARELESALGGSLAELGLDPERAGHATTDGRLHTLADLSTQNATALELARRALSADGGVMDKVDAALRRRTLHRLSGLVESTRTKDLEPVFPPDRPTGPIADDSHVRLISKVFRTKIAGRLVLSVDGASFTPEAPFESLMDAIQVLEEGDAVALRELTASGNPDVSRFLAFALSRDALAIVD